MRQRVAPLAATLAAGRYRQCFDMAGIERRLGERKGQPDERVEEIVPVESLADIWLDQKFKREEKYCVCSDMSSKEQRAAAIGGWKK